MRSCCSQATARVELLVAKVAVDIGQESVVHGELRRTRVLLVWGSKEVRRASRWPPVAPRSRVMIWPPSGEVAERIPQQGQAPVGVSNGSGRSGENVVPLSVEEAMMDWRWWGPGVSPVACQRTWTLPSLSVVMVPPPSRP